MLRDGEIAEALPIVEQEASMAKRRYPRADREELFGVGQLALVEAAGRYRTGRGASFKHFVRVRVRGAMLDLVRSEARRRNDGSRQVTVDSLDGLEEWRQPAGGLSPEDVLARKQTIELLADLPTRERAVLVRTRISGEPCLNVADDLGVSVARVLQLGLQGEARLRRRAA